MLASEMANSKGKIFQKECRKQYRGAGTNQNGVPWHTKYN